MAHPGLGRQMDDARDFRMCPDQFRHAVAVGNVQVLEAEAGMGREKVQQRLTGMVSDEADSAGDQDRYGMFLHRRVHWNGGYERSGGGWQGVGVNMISESYLISY